MELNKEILEELKKMNAQLSQLIMVMTHNNSGPGANIPENITNFGAGLLPSSTNISKDLGVGDIGKQVREQIEQARRAAEAQVSRMGVGNLLPMNIPPNKGM